MKIPIVTVSGIVVTVAALGAGYYLRPPTVRAEAETDAPAAIAPWTNPTPYTYREGDHLSERYGAFGEVPDWDARGLPSPPPGTRWVRYAETYLLVDSETGMIQDVLQVSWDPGRA